jgi:hypothetical protein
MGYFLFVKLRVFILFFFISAFSFCSSKKGCIDPGSISYDPDAKIDDGSCEYPSFTLTPVKISELDKFFNETSALEFRDNRLWTLIDAEGEKKIYSLNMVTGQEEEHIEVPGISAVDFEALSGSSTHFFIGDIGNNFGDRQDLGIYKIPKPTVYNVSNTASYEHIGFIYPEQTDLRKNEKTNFDAESMFYWNDYLYIFTKNHVDEKTSMYRIPAHSGNYNAEIKGVFNVRGVLTDADISPDGSKVVLAGHNKTSGKVFIWVLKDFDGTKFFSGKKFLVEIGDLTTVGQIEGVDFYDNNVVFLSNEKNSAVDASLYYLNISSVQ